MRTEPALRAIRPGRPSVPHTRAEGPGSGLRAALGLLALFAACSVGCRSDGSDPADLEAGPAPVTPVTPVTQQLDAAERARVLSALQEAAAGYESTSPPGPAAAGWRWSDVPGAVNAACNDVEMAIFATEVGDDRSSFVLRTADDRPALLVVSRTGSPPGYATEVSIGRFGDDELRGSQLVAAFIEHLERLGAKPGFGPD